MSKRRTRKEKITAKHQYTISWNPNPEKNTKSFKSSSFEANVKGQFTLPRKQQIEAIQPQKKADNGVKDSSFAHIRFDLLRSIGISALIILIELVIYSFWK